MGAFRVYAGQQYGAVYVDLGIAFQQLLRTGVGLAVGSGRPGNATRVHVYVDEHNLIASFGIIVVAGHRVGFTLMFRHLLR